MTVTRLRAEMPLSEWAEWIAYKAVQSKLREEEAKKAQRSAPKRGTHRRRARRRR